MPAQAQPNASPDQNLIERNWRGLNLSSSPTALQDGELQECEAAFVYAPGHIEVFAGPLPIGYAPEDIYRLFACTLPDGPWIIAQGYDGSVMACQAQGGALQTIAPAGSTTLDGFHVTSWKGADADGNPAAMLWVDTAKGYGSWNGSTWTVLDASVVGQAICIFSGRVWIASGNEVIFTAPDAYNDFRDADYAGSFTVTDPNLDGPVMQLVTCQNWLYLIGSGMVALNNVQVQSVGGSSALVTTYYITGVSASLAVTNDRAAIVIDNMLYIVTNSGVWQYAGLNGVLISNQMGMNFAGSMSLAAHQQYGHTFLIIDNGYFFDINTNAWFTCINDAMTWQSITTVSSGALTAFAAGSQSGDPETLYQVGGDIDSVREAIVFTKLYDAGNATLAKRVTKFGFETFASQLLTGNWYGGNVTPGLVITTARTYATSRLWGYTGSSQRFYDPPVVPYQINAAPNTWTWHAVNLVDRYFGLHIIFEAPPGYAIGTMMVQFQRGADWPPQNWRPMEVQA